MSEATDPEEGVPVAEGGSPTAWRSDSLDEVPLKLATPQHIIDGLRLVGLQWQSRTVDDLANPGDHLGVPGLYAWVDGANRNKQPNNAGILYIGIGRAKDGGMAKRIKNEFGWRTGEHAHGRMIARRRANCVAGPVTAIGTDWSFLKEILSNGLDPKAESILKSWSTGSALKRAEEFAVRLTVHLGDTVAPVNSQYAGAWANDRGADWAAFAVATFMEHEFRSTTI